MGADLVVVDWFHPDSKGLRVFDCQLEADLFANDMRRRGCMVQTWTMSDPDCKPRMILRGPASC